jgi:sarcosine/dimethylglycine N-methyltransferase
MTDERVQDHYASTGTGSTIAARIAAAVRLTGGPDTSITPETLAPFDHFHGGGLAATQDLAAALQPQAGEMILDIGCGIGGPARWIANRYNCSLTGVDLTQEFCDAARELNSLCGMADQVRIVEGSALSLPLPDAVFDRAFSQFMVMNIADKASVYREAFRVLKPGGRFVACHVGSGPNGPPEFPLPWAATSDHSFLATDEDTKRDFAIAGFEVAAFRDTTQTPRMAEMMRHTLETEGLPAVGSHVLVGDRYLQLLVNALRATEQGRVRTVEIVAERRS